MNRLSNILGAAVVIAIALVFVVQFGPQSGSQAPKGPGITCAVEVRGACVPSTDFWAAYRLIAPPNADQARLKSMGLRRLTAEGLYERYLLNEDAKRLGITVSDDDLNAELVAGRAHVSLPADKMRQVGYPLGLSAGDSELIRFLDVKNRQTKKFDNKRYERDVRARTKLSPSDYRDFQKRELIASRMRDLVRSRVRVSENEAFDQFSREKSTRTIDIVRFDRRFYADLVVDTSEKAVQAWADQNKEELGKVWEARKSQYLPECRVTRHILARIKPGEDEAAQKAAAKAKIEKVEEALKKGEDFAAVARRMSDDPGSGQRGGDLGCIQKGRMVKPFEDKVFEMKAGEVSGPVESEFGFHIINVQQIAKEADAEKVGRQMIARELYTKHESERLAAEAAKQVLAAVAGGKTLQQATDDYLATLTAAEQAAGGKKKDAKKDEKAVEKAVEKKDEKKEEGEKKDDAAAKSDAPADENAPLTVSTHPHRPTVETSLPFNATGEPIPSAQPGTDVARIAFELGKPGDVPKDLVPLDNGYAVIQLKEVKAVSQEQWDKERDYYVTAMRTAKQNDALIGYIRRLKSTIGSEVKYDTGLITEPKETSEDTGEPPIGDEGE